MCNLLRTSYQRLPPVRGWKMWTSQTLLLLPVSFSSLPCQKLVNIPLLSRLKFPDFVLSSGPRISRPCWRTDRCFRQLKSVPTFGGMGTPVPNTLVTDHLSKVKPQASLAIPEISEKRKFHSFFHPLEGGVWGMPEAWSKYTFNFFNNNGRRNCRQIL